MVYTFRVALLTKMLAYRKACIWRPAFEQRDMLKMYLLMFVVYSRAWKSCNIEQIICSYQYYDKYYDINGHRVSESSRLGSFDGLLLLLLDCLALGIFTVQAFVALLAWKPPWHSTNLGMEIHTYALRLSLGQLRIRVYIAGTYSGYGAFRALD